MKNLGPIIEEFEQVQSLINKAQIGDYEKNKTLFNRLKNLLIENGFDVDVIAIDQHKYFFKQPKDYEKLYHI